jgi:hypothetical protein
VTAPVSFPVQPEPLIADRMGEEKGVAASVADFRAHLPVASVFPSILGRDELTYAQGPWRAHPL